MKNQIILHRSIKSPYSQKAMLMLDYANLDWQSVLSSKGMPRPIQEKLVGEYSRRIPVLQVGADLYCDTDMISRKIAELADKPYLDRLTHSPEIQAKMYTIEQQDWMAVLGSMSIFKFIWTYLRKIPFKDAIELLSDRGKIAKRKDIVNPLTKHSKQAWAKILEKDLRRFNAHLQNQHFLLLKDEPTAYDFTLFTSVWYLDFLNEQKILGKLDSLQNWLARMNQFSNNHIIEIAANESLNIAKTSEPLFVPDELSKSPQIGKTVAVPINDPTAGTLKATLTGILIGEDDYKYIVKRENDDVGTVHVHIPKQCYGACG